MTNHPRRPSRRLTRTGAVALAAASALLLAACGSRADFTVSGAAPVDDQSLGQQVTTAPPAAGTPLPTGHATGRSPVSVLPTGSADTEPGSVLTPGKHTSRPASAPPTVSGPVSHAPIRVGFVLQDSSGANALLGAAIPQTSDARQEQIAKWLVAYINSHGGVGGRKIVPTFKTVSATSTDPVRVTACEAMAQDQHVQAVIDVNEFLADDDWACFARNHVNYFGNTTTTDQAFMSAHAPYVVSTGMALNRQMAAIVAGANRVGFLKGQKVGVILPDTPEAHNDYAKVMGPALSRVGITPTVRYIGLTTGGNQVAQTDNAELAFATSGVKRIFFFHSLVVYLAFTAEASVEHYTPEYAFPDFAGAAGIAGYYGSAQSNAGSIAVSSQPGSVLPNDKENVKNAGKIVISRKTASPAVRNCLDILSKASHVNFYDPKQSQDPIDDAFYYCDELFLFWKAADNLGTHYTPSSFGRGLAQVGRYNSTLNHSDEFVSGRYDGATSYAVGRYNAKCSCFVQATPWIAGP